MGVAAERVELGSPQWTELAKSYLRDAIATLGSTLDRVSFSMCEVFTGAPEHLADGDGNVAWWFRIDGPVVEVGRGPRDDVQVRVDVDYAETLPWARLVYDMSNPEVAMRLAERERARKAALGDQPNPLDALPPDLRAALTGLHNFLAPRTA